MLVDLTRVDPGAARDGGQVDALPVVGHDDLEGAVRAGEARDADDGLARFAEGFTPPRLFDAVIHGISHEVHEGGEDPLGDRLVELGAGAVEIELHGLSGRPPEAAA